MHVNYDSECRLFTTATKRALLPHFVMPKIHYKRFPVTSSYTGKLPTCHGLVADLLATRPTSPQQVHNKLATFVVMEFGKRRDTTDN